MNTLTREAKETAAEDTRDASIPQLLGRLTGQITTLARHEVQLAKAEVRESLQEMSKYALLAGLGLLILQAGLLFSIGSLGLILRTVVPAWAAWLTLGLVCASIGGVLLRRGWTGFLNGGVR